MKFDLTPADRKQLAEAVDSNPVRKWLKTKEFMKFEVGDVLVKYHLRTDYQTKKQTWDVENIKSDNKMAQRYVYVYEDDTGIGYLKALRLSDGSLGKELFCLADFDYSHTKFEVDPEYAERTLLDIDYDIKELHKKSLEGRKIVQKMNRKIGQKPKTLKEYNTFFEALKPGDKFWTSQDFTAKYVTECTLDKIEKVTVSKADQINDWAWRRWKEKNPTGKDETYLYKLYYQGKYGKEEYHFYELHNYVFYTQEPAKVVEG